MSEKLRLVIVSPTDLSSGRGAENVLAGVLPALADRARVLVLSLGPTRREFDDAAERSGVSVVALDCRTRGWFVPDGLAIAHRVAAEATAWRADVVLLYWEIWDLVRTFSRVLPEAGLPFAVFLHAIPFAYAPSRPGSFYVDGFRRAITDRDPLTLYYTLRRMHSVGLRLRGVGVLSANSTVSFYLRRYFPRLRFHETFPPCATTPSRRSGPNPVAYDCVFMAKLIPGKGIHQLPAILARIRTHRPAARLLVIGTFERAADERRFRGELRRLGLADQVELAGWLRGERKYAALSSGRVFVYPSFAADTFSIALLESLACGVPAVAYDVPFVRENYRTPAVRTARVGDPRALADAAIAVLEAADYPELCAAASAFAADYTSWVSVAEGQLTALQAFLDRMPF